MFREILLATTALLAVTVLSFADAQSAGLVGKNRLAGTRQIASAIANSHADKNTEFLCTYGGYDVSDYVSISDYFYASGWKHVAVPVRGRGRMVDKIIVQDGANRINNSRMFNIGIYNNARGGMPGDLIASGTREVGRHCPFKMIAIPQTFLENHKKYWVVETVAAPEYRGRNWVTWGIDPVAPETAYSQYHRFSVSGLSGSHHHSYTSPWTRINGRAPFVRVK